MAQRSIHVLRQPAATPSRWPPLLFLHGGYVDARCWLPHFLPYFASHGYDCHAADLPGHGRSEGRACLDRLGLDDYLADLTPVVEGLGSRPVVIGHSMGALLAERLLERSLAEAAVLLSPVPPNGTLESSLSLFLRHPGFISAVATMSSGVFDDDGMRLLRTSTSRRRLSATNSCDWCGSCSRSPPAPSPKWPCLAGAGLCRRAGGRYWCSAASWMWSFRRIRSAASPAAGTPSSRSFRPPATR